MQFVVKLIQGKGGEKYSILVISQAQGNHGFGFMAYHFTWLSFEIDGQTSKAEIQECSDIKLERFDSVKFVHLTQDFFLKSKSFIYGPVGDAKKMNGMIEIIHLTPETKELVVDSFEGKLISGHTIIKNPESGAISVKVYYVVVTDFKEDRIEFRWKTIQLSKP